jgi:uncharacterized secreted protein with C-terminal beta-propeller domain
MSGWEKEFTDNLDADNYTDEELMEHINLEDPYDETELIEKLVIIRNMFGSSSGETVDKYLEFYNQVEIRLKKRIEPETEEIKEQEIPKIKISTIKEQIEHKAPLVLAGN